MAQRRTGVHTTPLACLWQLSQIKVALAWWTGRTGMQKEDWCSRCVSWEDQHWKVPDRSWPLCKQLVLLCVGHKESQFQGIRDLRLEDEGIVPLMSFPSPVTPKCLHLLELMSIPEADRDWHYVLLFVLVFLLFPICGAQWEGDDSLCCTLLKLPHEPPQKCFVLLSEQ